MLQNSAQITRIACLIYVEIRQLKVHSRQQTRAEQAAHSAEEAVAFVLPRNVLKSFCTFGTSASKCRLRCQQSIIYAFAVRLLLELELVLLLVLGLGPNTLLDKRT